jgi:Flp pilus assembly protein protease CpaA
VAAWDWRTGLIPNWLTLPVAAAVGALRLYQGHWYLLVIWALLYLVWRINFMGGGDAKLLMGLFALFPTEQFALLLAGLALTVMIPTIVIKHWGKRPLRLVQGVAGRLSAGKLLPTREELEQQGRRFAWAFCLPGIVYTWWLW